MDPQIEVREFLMRKRNALTPDMVGLRQDAGRRVPGLRREEVAHLAGVSVEYYTRIERGRLTGASAQVLDAIARALQLTEDERLYLFDLAQPHTGRHTVRERTGVLPRQEDEVSSFMLRFLNSIDAPALIQNHRLEIIAANAWAQELFSPLFALPRRPVSNAHFAFLDPQARTFYADYDLACNITVGALRSSVGKNPLDRELTQIIGELSTLSQDFAQRWAQFSVIQSAGGRKVINHPRAGRLDLTYDDLILPDQPHLMLLTYMATPGTGTEERLRILQEI